MYASFFLTVTAATSVLAGCFSGGENWASQKAMALAKAQDVCNTKYSTDAWSGGQQLGACYDLDSGKKVDFVLEKISDGLRNISPEECYDGFQKEINGCENGGSTSYTNWKYT